jgi:N-acetyl-gamma-glutamyl-phosphate reductase
MHPVAIVGATGFAGREVCAWLGNHPNLQLTRCISAREDAQPARNPVRGAPDIEPLTVESLADLAGVFLATPHGASAPIAAAALEQGVRVVDLSGDLRLPDVSAWEAAYGQAHTHPSLARSAVYGLTEFARTRLQGAHLVANPGCYPTAVLLGAKPLLDGQLIDTAAPLIADCKSGVSGAGKAPTDTTHYANVNENFRAYGVGTHRHAPEIEHHLGGPQVIFVPHLLPCFRGILATLYLKPSTGTTLSHARAALDQAYAGEPFIEVTDTLPSLNDVTHTNRCHIGIAENDGMLVVVSVIDNLIKGAAGQAIQNMNAMLGLPETVGLE